MALRWTPEPVALDLLAEGSPFNAPSYREGLIASFPEYRDVSFGAEADDGTRAAIALLVGGRAARSLPLAHGGIVATRWLTAGETDSFLEAARRSARAASLVCRSVPIGRRDRVGHVGGRVVGWTSVVFLGKGVDLEAGYAFKARRSIRTAMAAGSRIRATPDPEAFLRLYVEAAREHEVRFPETLLRTMGAASDLRCFDICLGSDAVASAVAVPTAQRWEGWLLAQDERGRRIDANYLAVHALLEQAQREHAAAVDLGVSPDLPGVAHFKRRFGAVGVPVLEDRSGEPADRLGAGAWRGVRRRLHRRRR